MNKIVAITLFCLFSVAGFAAVQAGTPLELSMKRMSKAYKQLALDLKQPSDATKADYLALAAAMKTEVATSRGLVPKKADGLPADQQAAMVAAYQKSMDDLGASIDGLTQDIQNGQWDDANKQLATIKHQMIDGHKAFRNQEKMPVFTTITPQAPPSQPTPPPPAPSPAVPPPAPAQTPPQ